MASRPDLCGLGGWGGEDSAPAHIARTYDPETGSTTSGEAKVIERLQQILMTGQMVLPEGMTAEELQRKHELEHGAYW
jgi:hypothetical protein